VRFCAFCDISCVRVCVCVFVLQSETETIICGWNVCICCNEVGMKKRCLDHTVHLNSLRGRYHSLHIYIGKGTYKGNANVHPETGHEGPEGGQSYSSTISLTSALDGVGWSTPCSGGYTPGKDPVPVVQEAGWAPGPVGIVA
jgi:hypothetical protein